MPQYKTYKICINPTASTYFGLTNSSGYHITGPSAGHPGVNNTTNLAQITPTIYNNWQEIGCSTGFNFIHDDGFCDFEDQGTPFVFEFVVEQVPTEGGCDGVLHLTAHGGVHPLYFYINLCI